MTAFVFLHGFTGSPRAFKPLIAALPLTTRVLAPALIGHDPRIDYTELWQTACEGRGPTFEDEVDRVAELIRHSGFEGAHVVGYSLGARVALGLCVRHSELVARASLIGVNPGLRTPSEHESRGRIDREWCQLLETAGIAAFVANWQEMPLFRSQEKLPESVRAEQARERLQHSALGLSLSLRATGLARMPNYWPALAGMSLPVDLIVGELDEKFRALATEAGKLLPDARLCIVGETGHNVLLERPDAISRLLSGGGTCEGRCARAEFG